MPENPAAKPDPFQRGLFIASLTVLFVGLCFWLLVVVRPFKVIYEQLGMTELPWVTEVSITLSNAALAVLPIAALALLLTGLFALKKAGRRTLNRMTIINLIVAALMPGYLYFVVLMPVIELQRKLGGGS